MARRPAATDLCAPTGLGALMEKPVFEVAEATLAAGESMVQTWRDLEPIVQALTKKVRTFVDEDTLDGIDAAKLLALCATVVQKVGVASTGMLRATEGQAKLALLLEAGRGVRRQPHELTQKQLIQVVCETVKKLQEHGKPCPACGASAPIELDA